MPFKLLHDRVSNIKVLADNIWGKLIIVVMMMALMAAVAFEYKASNKLLDENEKLLNEFAISEFTKIIQFTIAGFPNSQKELKEEWLRMPANFTLLEGDKRIYPIAFVQAVKSENDILWERYFNFQEGKQNLGGELSRHTILHQLSSAIEAGNQGLVNSLSAQFINHLRFYKLGSMEELISRLAFIDLGQASRWNDNLIHTLMITGHTDFLPVLYYLFIDNPQMNQGDYERSIKLSKKAMELSGIDGSKLIKFEEARHNHFHTEMKSLGTSIASDAVHFWDKQYQLSLPFDVDSALLSIQKSFIEDGLLDRGDTIEFELSFPINLTKLKLGVNKETWQNNRRGLALMSLIKLLFIIMFCLLLLVIVHRYERKQQHKHQQLTNQEKFIHFVGHELKTPVASIRLMSETLVKRQEAQLPAKDYANRIVNEADKLDHMVDNLLSLQRLQQSGIKLHLETLSIFDLIEQSIQAFIHNTPENMQIDNKVDANIEIESEATLLGLVIKNLIDNAVKYCSEEIVKVEFSFNKKKQQLQVKDNGIGISASDPQKVFESFYQDTDSKQGFGIGLSLCKTIMQRLQGDIYVESTSLSGTVWHIDFERKRK